MGCTMTMSRKEEHLSRLFGRRRLAFSGKNGGNPRVAVVTEEDGARTVITDTDTNQCFGIRTADLENATQLCVHAENPPAIGNWRKE